MTADPGKTHALVVGIERYGDEAWDLDGPAVDARRLSDYLVTTVGVPPGQVHLLLSPLEKNEEAVAGSPEARIPAGGADVAGALASLAAVDGELLFVFWAGHGFADAGGKRRLFYSDARTGDLRNFDLAAFLASLATNHWRFASQVVIVDACANYVDARTGVPGGDTFTPGAPRPLGPPPQAVLCASGLGVATRERSRFFPALLEKLKGAQTWPPEVPAIARELTSEVGGRTAPVYYLKDWTGSVETDRLPLRTALAAIEEARAAELVELALGLDLGPGALLRIYGDCAPPSLPFQVEPEAVETDVRPLLSALVELLRTAAAGARGIHPLLRLALHLEREAAKSPATLVRLAAWTASAAADLGTTPEELNEGRVDVAEVAGKWEELRPVLLVRVSPARPTAGAGAPEDEWPLLVDDTRFFVKAALLIEPYGATEWSAEVRLELLTGGAMAAARPLEALRAQLNTWADGLEKRFGVPVRVEVFLPWQLLGLDVDQWRRTDEEWGEGDPVGVKHRVVVRSWDRIYDKSLPAEIANRWRRKRKLLGQAGDDLEPPSPVFDREKFQAKLKDESGACLALGFPLARPEDAKKVLVAGASVALWLRSEPAGPDPEGEWLRRRSTLKAAGPVARWEDVVHTSRRDLTDSYGGVITLLSDDPYKLPPDADDRLVLQERSPRGNV